MFTLPLLSLSLDQADLSGSSMAGKSRLANRETSVLQIQMAKQEQGIIALMSSCQEILDKILGRLESRPEGMNEGSKGSHCGAAWPEAETPHKRDVV